MSNCKDCRFFNGGNKCAMNRMTSAGNYACSNFSQCRQTSGDKPRYCRDCRFFNGNGKCAMNRITSAGNYACSQASHS